VEPTKTRKYITIEISTETQGRIRTLCEKLEQILNKNHVSIDQALQVMFETHPIDLVLQRLMEEKF